MVRPHHYNWKVSISLGRIVIFGTVSVIHRNLKDALLILLIFIAVNVCQTGGS